MPRRNFASPTFHYTFGPHAPAITLDTGDALRITCPDADNQLAAGGVIPSHQRDRGNPPSPIEGNPVAGPIAVRGVHPGDALAVTIDGITLDSETGRTLMDDGHGLLTHDELPGTPPRWMQHWRLDHGAGVARLDNAHGSQPISVTFSPMVGCIGVCPPEGGVVSTIDAGEHGGNLDLPSITAGCTLLLPVFAEGGLLMLGDIHAAQGHGEIIGGGIETTGQVDITVRRLAALHLRGPVLVTEDRIAAVFTATDAGRAIRGAYGALLAVLVESLGMQAWDGYALLSQVAAVELGRCAEVSPTGRASYTVAAGIAWRALPDGARAAWESRTEA